MWLFQLSKALCDSFHEDSVVAAPSAVPTTDEEDVPKVGEG